MSGYKGHLSGGIFLGYGLVYLLSYKMKIICFYELTDLIWYTLGLLFGALLPDIDLPQSFLGRFIAPISAMIYKTVGHRTFTHSIVFIFLVSLILSLFCTRHFVIGTVIGMISHIILDLLCMGYGVAFLYPFYKKRIMLGRSHKHK